MMRRSILQPAISDPHGDEVTVIIPGNETLTLHHKCSITAKTRSVILDIEQVRKLHLITAEIIDEAAGDEGEAAE